MRACCRHVWNENNRVLLAVDALKLEEAHELGRHQMRDRDAMPLDQRSLAVYARLHPRIFYVDALTMQDSLELRMRARVAQDWLNRNYRMVAQITTRGPVTVRLYVANAMSADVP